MKKNIVILVSLLVLTACGGDKKPDLTVNPNTAIFIDSVINFKKGAAIASVIKKDCELPTKLSHFVKIYSDEAGVGVLQTASIKKKKNRLVMEIVEAVSGGNAFMGHRKMTKITGTLYKNGKKVASFTAARISGGGMFGGMKGSCSVLGRTVDAIGEDVATWLKNPVNGAHLGDSA